MSVRVTGVRQALRAIGRVPVAMREARAETLREWASVVESSAKARTPRRTGELVNSIEHKVHERAGVASVGVWKQEQLEYALYVERGTSSMAEQPYLVPAFNEHRRGVARAYRAAFRRHLGM